MNDTAILDAPISTAKVKKAGAQQNEPSDALESHVESDHLSGLDKPLGISRRPRKCAAVAATATHRPLRYRRSSSLARRQR